MKFFHLADLHLGKNVNGFSMLEDQSHMLDQVLQLIDIHQPDALLLAGDLYDKAIPSGEAVTLFDRFLDQLAQRRVQVFGISGNHDSAERLAFGSSLMDRSGIHLSPLYRGNIEPYLLEDAYGPVAVYLLPFLRPANVRRYFPEEEIASYEDAMKTVIASLKIDPNIRNIAVAHQFVTWQGEQPEQSDSEQRSLGGIDHMDASLFFDFDYTALGHIHGPQRIGRDNIRYGGSPLKYSFSEMHHKKSITLVELGAKGDVAISQLPLTPARDFAEIRGSFDELITGRENDPALAAARSCYCHIILTDEDDVPDAANRLRQVYPYFMLLDYDNSRTRSFTEITGAEAHEEKTPQQLLGELFRQQNDREMTATQLELLDQLVPEIWRESL